MQGMMYRTELPRCKTCLSTCKQVHADMFVPHSTQMPTKFPGASIKTYRSSGQPNLDRTLVTFDSLGVKVRVNAWQYHKTRGGFYATDGGIDKGMDVWVQTTPRFACGKVTGLCGNFDWYVCNRAKNML